MRSIDTYRELFEANPDAVVVSDAATRTIQEANAAAERLYGRTRGELIGAPASSLVAANPEPVMRDGLLVRYDLRADRTAVPVEVTATTVDRDGASYVVEVIRDVSERERAAAERAALEQRLQRADRLEALGRLAAGVAHDFNNLLCSIGMGVELAAETLNDPDSQAELDRVKTAVASAGALTRQLLAFSGRQVTRPQIVDVNTRIHFVARMLERTLGARVRIVLELSAMPVTVLIDPGQLEQMITNLAVNARDAMPSGGTLTISTRPCAPGGVAIVVHDTGIGIPPEIIDDIFEPFFTTKGPDHGTGLGLATVREIAHRNGGGVRVTSQVGHGTAFEIWLPGVDGLAYETQRLARIVPAGRGESVLVVEDDARVREVTRRVLASGGYAVYDVHDAEAALSYVSRGAALDVLVTDLELPGLSGVDCAQQIIASTPNTAVLYTSGMVSEPRALGGISGAVFLPKPYSSDELMRSVRKAIDARSLFRSPLG